MIRLGKLTDQQVAFLETVPFHLEARDTEQPATLRAVYPTLNQAGRWFSERWETVPWDIFRPSVELRR